MSFSGKLDFSNKIIDILQHYGTQKIIKIELARKPISKNIERALNMFSFGKFNELKNKLPFDELFHLSLILTLQNGKEISLEKNSIVNMDVNKSFIDTEINTLNKRIKYDLIQFICIPLKKMGREKFFIYDPFKNNCQMFIRNVLISLNLYDNKTDGFLFQDISSLINGLPQYIKYGSRKITDLASFGHKIIGTGCEDCKINGGSCGNCGGCGYCGGNDDKKSGDIFFGSKKNKIKPIPLVDIRFVLKQKNICITAYKAKYKKDLPAFKALINQKSNNMIKIDSLKTREQVMKKIEDFNKKNCNKSINKMKRPQLLQLAKKLNIIIDEDIRGKAPRQTTGNPLRPLQDITGIKKFFTDKQQEQYKKELEYKDDPFELSERKDLSLDKTEPVILKPEQKKLIEKLIYSNDRGALAFWGVGTGKTILTVVSIKLYLQYYPNSKVVFIAPSALLSNLIEKMYSFGLEIRDRRIEYFSIDKFSRSSAKRANICDNALVIIDEAHNLRTEIGEKDVFSEGKEKKTISTGGRPLAIISRCTNNNSKTLLLTATPNVNTPFDMENLLAMIDGRKNINRKNFDNITSNRETAGDYFKLRISFHKNQKNDKDFPRRNEKLLNITMDDNKGEMKAILRSGDPKIKAYYGVARQFSNTVDNFKKLRVVAQLIKKNIEERKISQSVVYFSFVENGVDKFTKFLDALKIKYSIVSGNEGPVEKQKSKEDYNKRRSQVMIITKAGAEGLDLKNTTNIFVIDQPWNEATREQVIGRGIRYKSHESLPEKDRVVNIYNVIITFKEDSKLVEIIKGITNDKDYQLLLNEVRDKEAEAKAKEKKNLKQSQIVFVDEKMKLEAKQKGISNTELYSKSINKYASKNKEMNLTSGMISDNVSIDIKLFLMSKTKQYVINDFEKWLKNDVPMFEKGVSSVERLILNRIEEEKPKTNSERYKIYSEEMKKTIGDGDRVLTKARSLNNRLIELFSKAKDKSEEKKRKNANRIFQEYFTQDKEIEKLYKLSGMEKDKRNNTMFLEPTAGNGNIIQYVKKRNLETEFRCCEFSTSNRLLLKEYIKSVKMSVEDTLYSENNFLNLQTSDRFSYCIMNPPFNLSMGETYTRKIYDIDFIKKAYSLLRTNGVLVAILYQPHTNENLQDEVMKNNQKWLSSKISSITNEKANFEEWMSKKSVKVPISIIKIIKKNTDEDNDILTEINKLNKYDKKEFPAFNKEQVPIALTNKEIIQANKEAPKQTQKMEDKKKKDKPKEKEEKEVKHELEIRKDFYKSIKEVEKAKLNIFKDNKKNMNNREYEDFIDDYKDEGYKFLHKYDKKIPNVRNMIQYFKEHTDNYGNPLQYNDKIDLKYILDKNMDEEFNDYTFYKKDSTHYMLFSKPLQNITDVIQKLQKENKQETKEYVKALEKLSKFVNKNKNKNWKYAYYPYYGITLMDYLKGVAKKIDNKEKLKKKEKEIYDTLNTDYGNMEYSRVYKKFIKVNMNIQNDYMKTDGDWSSYHLIMGEYVKDLNYSIKKIKEDLKNKKINELKKIKEEEKKKKKEKKEDIKEKDKPKEKKKEEKKEEKKEKKQELANTLSFFAKYLDLYDNREYDINDFELNKKLSSIRLNYEYENENGLDYDLMMTGNNTKNYDEFIKVIENRKREDTDDYLFEHTDFEKEEIIIGFLKTRLKDIEKKRKIDLSKLNMEQLNRLEEEENKENLNINNKYNELIKKYNAKQSKEQKELIRNILRNVGLYIKDINDYIDRLEDDEEFEMPEIREFIPKKKEVKKKTKKEIEQEKKQKELNEYIDSVLKQKDDINWGFTLNQYHTSGKKNKIKFKSKEELDDLQQLLFKPKSKEKTDKLIKIFIDLIKLNNKKLRYQYNKAILDKQQQKIDDLYAKTENKKLKTKIQELYEKLFKAEETFGEYNEYNLGEFRALSEKEKKAYRDKFRKFYLSFYVEINKILKQDKSNRTKKQTTELVSLLKRIDKLNKRIP